MAVIDFELGKKAIVQIYYSDNDAIAGTGFWLGGRYLMTCAHVVGKALSAPDYSQTVGQSIALAFDEAGQSQKLFAEVIDSQYDAREGRQDVALLRLKETAPLQLANIRLATRLQPSMGAKISTYGYVYGNKVGRNITAMTNGSAKAWVQIEVSQDIGIPILEGLSGSPVWCQQNRMFVGMVVARDDLCPEARVGFMVPATELLVPFRLVQRRRLLDILEPQEQELFDQWMAAYRLCRNSYAVGRSRSNLAKILEDLSEKGAGAEDASSKLVQFVACLLNRLEHSRFESIMAELTAWANEVTDDLEAVKERMRAAASKQQDQAIAPLKPVLLVSVSEKSLDGTPTFSVQSWLILNPKRYDPLTGRGAESLSLKGYGEGATASNLAELAEEFEYAQMPLLLAAYLDQICRKGVVCSEGIDPSELTVELFLPFSLMNQPFERLGLSKLGFVEPLGISDPDCPQVLLRSQDRLDQSMVYSRWKKKWLQLESSQQEAATTLLVSNRKTLKRDLKDVRVLGMKLNTSPTTTNSGEIARLVISGAPVAVWVRNNPSAEVLFQRLEQDVLAHPLKEFPDEVLSLRRDTQELDDEVEYASSDELGHHLAVLWENPKHVPPDIQYSTRSL